METHVIGTDYQKLEDLGGFTVQNQGKSREVEVFFADDEVTPTGTGIRLLNSEVYNCEYEGKFVYIRSTNLEGSKVVVW